VSNISYGFVAFGLAWTVREERSFQAALEFKRHPSN